MKNCEWPSWLIVNLKFKRLIQKLVKIQPKIWKTYRCCIFWPVFGCCGLQMLARICFLTFCEPKSWKKEAKARNLMQNIAECFVFLSLHQNAGLVFYSQKKKQVYSGKNICLNTKGVNKYILTSVWNAQHPNLGWNIQQIEVMKKSQVDIFCNM